MEEELLIYLLRRKKNDTFLYKLLYYEEQIILAFVLSHILRHATKLISVLLVPIMGLTAEKDFIMWLTYLISLP